MAYVTQAELVKRSAELQFWTDDDASGAIDADVVSKAIALASAEIDDAAGQHYETPLTLGDATTADVIENHAGTIAIYKLASRRPNVAADIREMYQDTRDWLELLRTGKIALAGETAITAAKPSGGIVLGGGAAIVDRDSMDGL